MNQNSQGDDWIGRLKVMASAAGILVVLLGVWLVWGPRLKDEALPIWGQVPAFVLTGTDGKTFDSQELQGKIYVASFVFTSCKNSCPMLTLQMKRLAKLMKAGGGIALVSISVDPDKDTPEVLAAYAKSAGVDDPRWHFLTGKKKDIKALVQEGFKLTAQASEPVLDERGQPDILHSSKLVLVDGQGQIRGYYDGLLGSSVDTISSHIKRLVKD